MVPPGPHPAGISSLGKGNAKPLRSKRTTELEMQQKFYFLKSIPQLEHQQELNDEKAAHDATKAIASRLRLQHNDLVNQLDEAEMAAAEAEKRAWNSEKEVIELQENLSKARMRAQYNETMMELMAEEHQQLTEANARLVARAAARETEFSQEVDMMEERARRLEKVLTLAFKDVTEYSDLFQKNTKDWAELVDFLGHYKSETDERIQELQSLLVGYYDVTECFHDEVIRLVQAAEVRIARNRLSENEQLREANRNDVQRNSSVSQNFASLPLSESNLDCSAPFLGSPELGSDWSPRLEGSGHTGSLSDEISESSRPTSPGDSLAKLGNYGGGSVVSPAPSVADQRRGFTMFNASESRRRSGSGLESSFDSIFSSQSESISDRPNKRARTSPPFERDITLVDDREASLDSREKELTRNEELTKSNATSDVLRSTDPTECGVPHRASESPIENAEQSQASNFKGDHGQGNLVYRESELKGIQTANSLLLAYLDKLAGSLQGPEMAPKELSCFRGKPRSLSVGDLPRSLTGEAAAGFERMPGSWPHEVICNPDRPPMRGEVDVHAFWQAFSASVILISTRILQLLNPAHPQCIVYPALMAIWIWRAFERQMEWKRWQTANEAYFAQRLRTRHASSPGWMDSIAFTLSQWLAFDRSSFG